MTLTSLRRTFNSANRLSWVRVTRSANTALTNRASLGPGMLLSPSLSDSVSLYLSLFLSFCPWLRFFWPLSSVCLSTL